MYELRPYQKQAVEATLQHFRKQKSPAVIVLPTGAGKSLVIAELAKIARGRVLVLTHVKELVEQNCQKYESYGLKAGVFSASLGRKDTKEKVIFAGIQSIVRSESEDLSGFSLVVIDECHRISDHNDSQYLRQIERLKADNADVCFLGLTATPYRLDLGWVYEFHYEGSVKSRHDRFFKKCIFELPLHQMIEDGYLTPPVKIDTPVACYDFSALQKNSQSGKFTLKDIEDSLKSQRRITPGIINHIIKVAEHRKGVMIFTSSKTHAQEILALLPKKQSALILGETDIKDRDKIVDDFKNQRIKFLVNISVLTTGFDAPHVDLIAILRPTESVSLYQQIIGRGLRLSPGKEDCIILDYTGQSHEIYAPEVGHPPLHKHAEPVYITCPKCDFENIFWGIVDKHTGEVTEHFGRKCQGAHENPETLKITYCGYRFRFKICDECGHENDIAARQCVECKALLIDPDKKLQKAREAKNAHVMKPDIMQVSIDIDKKLKERIQVSYFDLDANELKEFYYLDNKSQKLAFYYNFVRMHTKMPGFPITYETPGDILIQKDKFKVPRYVIAYKDEKYWNIREKIFDWS